MAKLTFSDEFNNLSLWNGSSGTWSTNWWYNDEWGLYSSSKGSTLTGNGEQQWYINSNYAPTASVKPWSAQDGVLTITAKPADGSIQPLINDYKFTSGMVNTWHSFSQQYGYFEMSADLPAGQGLWPAFWLLPQDGSWPPELDVVEVLGNDMTRLYTTAHSNASGAHTMATQGTKVADMSNGFHTYGVDWQPDKLTFYFDGQQVFQTATPADMHKPMYMIANLAVGGHWPGSPDGGTPWPAEMKIDYIRAWDGNPHTGGGSPAAAPAQPSAAPKPSQPASGEGQVLTSPDNYSNMVGGSGADTFNASLGYDTLTGGAGADRFALAKEPWAPMTVSDFRIGEDKLDLSALFKASGYSGSDPVRDGYIHLAGDGADGTLVRFDRDGFGGGQPWPNTVAKLSHVSPNGLTWAQLDGGAAPASAPSAPSAPAASAPAAPSSSGGSGGQVLTAAGDGARLTGGAGADTLNASRGNDVLTGGGGADRFAFGAEPWAPIRITDFTPDQDKLDLSALFDRSGYQGHDPVADRYISVESDGAGGSLIRFDRDGGGGNPYWPNTIIDLEHVSPWQVKSSDWII